MIPKWIYMTMIACFIFVIMVIWSGLRNNYNRAVYDTCVRLSSTNGQVTLFDLQQCTEMQRHARNENWFNTPMPTIE